MNLTVFKPYYTQLYAFARLNSRLHLYSFCGYYFAWSRNLFKLASNPSFYKFYNSFRLRGCARSSWGGDPKLQDSTLRRLQLPFLSTQSNRNKRRFKALFSYTKTFKHSLVSHYIPTWTTHALASAESHKVLGLLPVYVFRGTSTSLYPNYNFKLTYKKKYYRVKRGGVAKVMLTYRRLNLFRKYMRSKIDMSNFDADQFLIVQKRMKLSRRLRNRKILMKPLPRFKPYKYLKIELPPRSFEQLPITHLMQFSQTSFSKTSQPFRSHRRKSRLGLERSFSPIPKLQSFFNLFHRRLPRRLQTKFRWRRYRTARKTKFRTRRNLYSYSNLLTSILPRAQLAHLATNLVTRSGQFRTPFYKHPYLSCQTGFETTRSKFKSKFKFTLPRSRERKQYIRHCFRRIGLFLDSKTLLNRVKRLIRQICVRQIALVSRSIRLVGSYAKLRPSYLIRLRFFYIRRRNRRIQIWVKKRIVRHRFYKKRVLSRPTVIKKGFIKSTNLDWTRIKLTPRARYQTGELKSNSPLPQIKLSSLYAVTSVLRNRIHKRFTFQAPSTLVNEKFYLGSLRTSIKLKQLTYYPYYNQQLTTKLQPFEVVLPTAPDVIRIYPTHSFTFKRSAFFFTNLILRPTPTQLDLIASRPISSPSFDYNVFPDANLIKVEAFRRLNRQKNLFNRRHLMFNSFKSAKLPPLKKTLTNKSPNARINPYSTQYSTTKSPSVFRHSMSFYKNTRVFSKNRYQPIKIQRVRFKPGYGRIWRKGRSSIREIVNIPVRYQYRLTPKVHWLYLQDRKYVKSHTPPTLDYLLLASYLIPDFWSLNEIMNAKLLYLNGSVVQNANLKVFVNDFIQITVSLHFYITLKWLRVWSETRQNRVNRVFYSKYRPSGTNRNYKFARPLPSWFFDLKLAYRSIPQIVEVDFFTLSLFVLYDKQPWDQTDPVRANLYDSTSLNMYNWKYIT